MRTLSDGMWPFASEAVVDVEELRLEESGGGSIRGASLPGIRGLDDINPCC